MLIVRSDFESRLTKLTLEGPACVKNTTINLLIFNMLHICWQTTKYSYYELKDYKLLHLKIIIIIIYKTTARSTNVKPTLKEIYH